MTAEDFLNVLGGLMNAGLKRVYFTGGEPLMSPLARPVLTRLPEHGPDATYTLITNGTLVRKNQEWLSATVLDKVKVSLHYFSDESLKAIANTRIGIAAILDATVLVLAERAGIRVDWAQLGSAPDGALEDVQISAVPGMSAPPEGRAWGSRPQTWCTATAGRPSNPQVRHFSRMCRSSAGTPRPWTRPLGARDCLRWHESSARGMPR
ncbi:radical SAM protein [Streptomyces acidicola]|uniref:radical SAM protein n=1 Tax=Streptomyces acidicola TaxID=2596892 RepID=UPI0034378166